MAVPKILIIYRCSLERQEENPVSPKTQTGLWRCPRPADSRHVVEEIHHHFP